MGQSLEECDRIIEAIERNRVRAVVGHSQSLDQPIIAMAEVVNSGRIGRPIMIHTSFYSDWVYRPRAAEELDPALGGGIVAAAGAHSGGHRADDGRRLGAQRPGHDQPC